MALGMSTAALTLSTYNSAHISMLELQIALNNKKVDHLVDVSNLHKQHFKAVDQKLEDSLQQIVHHALHQQGPFHKND